MPRSQEAKRHKTCSAELYVSHFSVLDTLEQEYSLDDERIWNLDETGRNPGKYTTGVSYHRSFLRSSRFKDAKVADFVNTHRVTMMKCISTACDTGPTLFVFKGAKFPYRTVLCHGIESTETMSTFLSRYSVISMRGDIAGDDGEKFYAWRRIS